MAISKNAYIHTSKGLKFNNGNYLTGWKVAFGMPFKEWDTGSATRANGWINTRYEDSTSFSLSGLSPGMEVIMADTLIDFYVSNGDSLDGTGTFYFRFYDTDDNLAATHISSAVSVDISSIEGEYEWQIYQTLGVTGIDTDEYSENGDYDFKTWVTHSSGDDISISTVTRTVTISNCPSFTNLGTSRRGYIWVEGNDLHWIGYKGVWEHVRTGDSQGDTGDTDNAGYIWIDSNNLHWIGANGYEYQLPWVMKQFESSFSPGLGANPSPGASYAGYLWVDTQNGSGWITLAYVGEDGEVYILGAGEPPDEQP